MGSTHPIVVQSMTNTDTADAAATAAQVRALHAAGSELVRVTVNTDEAARAVPTIVAEVDVPVIGDFHYNGHLLLTKYPACARALAKYRINPGNVGTKRRDDNFRTIIQVAINEAKPVRIGVMEPVIIPPGGRPRDGSGGSLSVSVPPVMKLWTSMLKMARPSPQPVATAAKSITPNNLPFIVPP